MKQQGTTLPANNHAIKQYAFFAGMLSSLKKQKWRKGMSESLHLTRNGSILEITLDRPKANAIDAKTSFEMGEVFLNFRDDPQLRVAIITGAGEKFFSAGWDLKAAAAARDVVELGRKGVYELHTVSAHSTGTIDNPATIAPPTHAVYSHADFPAGWRNIDPLQSYETLFNGVIFPSENKEMIFTTGQNNGDINTMIQHQMPIAFGGYNCHAMTGKQCDAYQMNTGKPFDKTKDWTGDENYVSAEEAASGDWAPLVEGVNKQYGHREPRFYATVAYNGCLWNGTNAVQSYDRNLIIWYYRGEESGWSNSGDRWLATGIGIRKFVSSRDNFKTEGGVISKPVIGIRYADVLLWYAEALNELGASTYQIPSWDGTQSYDISRDKNEMSYAISRVRIRGGVPDFGSDVYENADEFRKHLKHERQIELFAENSRYFDLRRWKDAEYEESQQMYGCNAYMSKTERDLFHTQVINSNLPTTFSRKMYFWPISHDQLRRNLRLTQNPGWTYYD